MTSKRRENINLVSFICFSFLVVYNPHSKYIHSFHSSSFFTETRKPNKLINSQPCPGFMGQLVEHCMEVMGSNPVGAAVEAIRDKCSNCPGLLLSLDKLFTLRTVSGMLQ